MRFAFPPLTPVVRVILVVLFASFVAQSLLQGLIGLPLFDWLALSPELDVPLAWQWATYPLVEYVGSSAVISRAIDLLLIWTFGAMAESHLGRNRTLQLVVVSVLGGAILPLAFGLLFGDYAMPAAGAGAIAWAMMGAFAVITRGAPVNFVLMPSMSAWHALGVFLVITALQSMWARTPTPLLIALGALAAAVLFVRWIEQRPTRPTKKTGGNGPRRRSGASHLQVIPGGQSSEDERPRWLN
ncbi:rhomboid family intramembrane serine protease [Sandaracinus amylolyticus]|uniref:rhomboid family intramembrane serine protease n=1 Tax=Sandaracinus amylolyticus TaxID=927083 RepID=UPI001F018C25|nr:rhomboid family intramembrane serine protease [Sandaracinus amylolyticus]UJR81813.1 Rhomboid domain-containing protein [Sandaracinus amylolyticus]